MSCPTENSASHVKHRFNIGKHGGKKVFPGHRYFLSLCWSSQRWGWGGGMGMSSLGLRLYGGVSSSRKDFSQFFPFLFLAWKATQVHTVRGTKRQWQILKTQPRVTCCQTQHFLKMGWLGSCFLYSLTLKVSSATTQYSSFRALRLYLKH